jgi:hypothetical protein
VERSYIERGEFYGKSLNRKSIVDRPHAIFPARRSALVVVGRYSVRRSRACAHGDSAAAESDVSSRAGSYRHAHAPADSHADTYGYRHPAPYLYANSNPDANTCAYGHPGSQLYADNGARAGDRI